MEGIPREAKTHHVYKYFAFSHMHKKSQFLRTDICILTNEYHLIKEGFQGGRTAMRNKRRVSIHVAASSKAWP